MTTETGIYEYAKQGLSYGADRTALWFYGKPLSFGTLFEKIDNVADHLYQFGVRQGTVVTIHLPNCPQAVVAFYAVAKLGGICSMVHALTPPSALRENMAFTGSDVLITHRADCGNGVGRVFLADVSSHMGFLSRTAYRLKNRMRAELPAFEALERKCAGKATVPAADSLGGECAVYLHSSGSTGKPKTILLSHSALNNCVDNTADFFENGDMEKQVSLGVLPLFHGFGLEMDVHRNVSFGSQLVMLARWNAKTAVKLIKKRRVTLMVGVPTMYHALLREPGFRGKRITQLSKCYVGADNVSPELIAEFDARLGGGHRMLVGYGLTEATTTNCVNSYLHYKAGSSGYPVRNTVLAVLNEEGALAHSGEGELVVSSKTLMLGYLKDEPATDAAFLSAEGRRWVRTGDCVYLDGDGFLHFMRRLKHVIVRNGYNIYPDQVEDVIRGVPGVADACVVGVTEEETHTQMVRAVVRLDPDVDSGAAEAAIREECLRMLPRYSVPGEIRFVSAFPQNAMGKVDRKELSRP